MDPLPSETGEDYLKKKKNQQQPFTVSGNNPKSIHQMKKIPIQENLLGLPWPFSG